MLFASFGVNLEEEGRPHAICRYCWGVVFLAFLTEVSMRARGLCHQAAHAWTECFARLEAVSVLGHNDQSGTNRTQTDEQTDVGVPVTERTEVRSQVTFF